MNNAKEMVVADQYKLLVALTHKKGGEVVYDPNGQKEIVRRSIQLPRDYVEKHNGTSSNKFYIINHEETDKLAKIRQDNIERQAKEKEVKQRGMNETLDKLADAISGKVTPNVNAPTPSSIGKSGEIDADATAEEEKIKHLKAECDKLGIKYHHKAGVKKLNELLETHSQEN